MIISDRYRYVFVELPHTGTTAISAELCEKYDGREVLYKHSTWGDFRRVASPEQLTYFKFSCIRHPMDTVVSLYFRYRSNHRNAYTQPKVARMAWSRRVLNLNKFHYIRDQGADFSDFFLRYYHLPYDNWSHVNHIDMDFVIRFERLKEDFERVLRKLSIPATRQLPAANTTPMREPTYMDYYDSRAMARARRIFGPFMRRWDYPCPEEWGTGLVDHLSDLQFQALSPARVFFWKHLRYRHLVKPGTKFSPLEPLS